MTVPAKARFASYKPNEKSTARMSALVACNTTSTVMLSPSVRTVQRSIRAGLVGWLKIAVTAVNGFVEARSGLGEQNPRPMSTGKRTKRRYVLSCNAGTLHVMDHKYALPDGVYVGFTGSFVRSDPFTHNFLTIIHDGLPTTYEYGPKASTDQYGTRNGADRNGEVQYRHTPDTAEFGLVRVPTPPGVTEDQFERRIKEAVERYKALPSYEQLPYNALNGANCENMVSGLLKYAGSSQADIEAIANAHLFGSIDPHFSKPLDLEALFDSLPARTPLPTQTITAPDGSPIHRAFLPNLGADGHACGTRETTARHQATGVPPVVESGTAGKPLSDVPLKTTEMTGEQIRLYVDLRKDARAIFAEALGDRKPTVSVERNGITSDRERFAHSTGRIVGLEDGKLIQQSARGQITAFDYGDLLVNAKDPVALDAMARKTMATGEPMNLTMQQGQVMLSQQVLGQQRTMQLGLAESSLGR